MYDILGGGFKYFVFSPRKLGKIPILTHIFQMGLKPPTSHSCGVFCCSFIFLRNSWKKCAMTLHLLVAAHVLRSLISLWRSLDWGEDGCLVLGWRSIAPPVRLAPRRWPSLCANKGCLIFKGCETKRISMKKAWNWNAEDLLPCTLTGSQKSQPKMCIVDESQKAYF